MRECATPKGKNQGIQAAAAQVRSFVWWDTPENNGDQRAAHDEHRPRRADHPENHHATTHPISSRTFPGLSIGLVWTARAPRFWHTSTAGGRFGLPHWGPWTRAGTTPMRSGDGCETVWRGGRDRGPGFSRCVGTATTPPCGSRRMAAPPCSMPTRGCCPGGFHAGSARHPSLSYARNCPTWAP